MNSFRSNNRQTLQNYTNIHKRPTFRGPQATQYRKPQSIASSSVYDPEESQRNMKLTLKQAITLITLRLGRLEVFANESKFGGIKVDSENSVDKDFLMSLVTRMDNMEKSHHNLRIEVEKNRQTLLSLNESLENLDIQDEPIILEIIEKLNSLALKTEEHAEMEPADILDVSVQLEVQPAGPADPADPAGPAGPAGPEVQSEIQTDIQSEILSEILEIPVSDVIEVIEPLETEKLKPKKRGKKMLI